MEPSSVPPNAHYLAEIKYPRIGDAIAIDKILSVLQKIRMTSKPITFKWAIIDKPKDGELFLEQKFPITRDSVNGDQFPIVDDGYLWSSIPKPEIREVQGQTVEVFRWFEGYAPGDQFFSVSKTEYRLKQPGNILFLVHYLTVKNPCVPVRPALPASKISPTYLQQQAQAQQQQPPQQKLPQLKLIPPQRAPSPKHPPPKKEDSHHQLAAVMNDSSCAPFDSFGAYEAAAYRFSLAKSFFNVLFEHPSVPSAGQKNTPVQMYGGLEDDLTAALEKKTRTIEDRIQRHEQEHAVRLDEWRRESRGFLEMCEKLKTAQNDSELDSLMTII